MEPMSPLENQPMRTEVITQTATRTSTRTKVMIGVGILAFGAAIAAGLIPMLNQNIGQKANTNPDRSSMMKPGVPVMAVQSEDPKYRANVIAKIYDIQTRIDVLQQKIAQCR